MLAYAHRMAPPPIQRGKSMLATVIGWIIVAVIAWWLLGFVIGTLRWVIRSVLILGALILLVGVYFNLKAPPDA